MLSESFKVEAAFHKLQSLEKFFYAFQELLKSFDHKICFSIRKLEENFRKGGLGNPNTFVSDLGGPMNLTDCSSHMSDLYKRELAKIHLKLEKY